MSTTPRTDAAVTGNSDPVPDEYEDLAYFARTLERELNRVAETLNPEQKAREETVEEAARRVIVERDTYRDLYRACYDELTTARKDTALVARIAGALQTGETGEDLVEVARSACRAEHELAALERHRAEADDAMRNAAGL